MKCMLMVLGTMATLLSASQEIPLGNPLPAMQWTVAQTGRKLSTTDLKGKVIIIDFWSTRCISCIRSFSKIDSFQKLLKEKVQFLLVSTESEKTVQDFFGKRRHLLNWPQTPVITGAAHMKNMFPHDRIPYVIWIDQEGIVRQRTDGEYLTVKNMENFVTNPRMHLPQRMPRAYTSPIEDWAGDPANGLNYFSYIATCNKTKHIGYKEGAVIGDSLLHIAANCSDGLELFRTAFQEGGRFRLPTGGHIILEVKDPYRLVRPTNPDSMETWKTKWSLNYELAVPKRHEHKLYRYMQEDLMRYFDVQAAIQKRKLPCLVLVRTSGVDKLKSKGGMTIQKLRPSTPKRPLEDTIRMARNIPYEDFSRQISRITEWHTGQRFLDATGYKGRIDMEINFRVWDNYDLEGLRAELKAYDLDIVNRLEWIDVLVISDNAKSQITNEDGNPSSLSGTTY